MPLFYTATGAEGSAGLGIFLPLILMLAMLYFLMIRPESKRKKQAEEMRSSLKKGDQITTIGGIVGKIVQVTDETIIIETSDDRVRMELTKWAVSTNNSNPPATGKKSKKAADSEEPPRIEEGEGEGK